MQIRLNTSSFLNSTLSKTTLICLFLSIMAICINACDRENPCDVSCNNGECVFSVDSVATTQDVTIQTSDTLTTSFSIVAHEDSIIHQNDTFPLVSSLIISSNVEISKTSNIPNSTAVFSLLTFPACDCFTGWDGVRCDEPDPCELIECKNDGMGLIITADSCYCECAPGFMGDLCETSAPCDTITCINKSHCEVNEDTGEGECVCDIGYEFPCIVETRQKFLGEYIMVLDSCGTLRADSLNVPAFKEPYTIVIEKDTGNIEQIIFNSTNTFGMITAKVKKNDSLFVDTTTTQKVDTVLQSLEGIYHRDIQTIDLLLKFTNTDGAVDTCQFIMEKQ